MQEGRSQADRSEQETSGLRNLSNTRQDAQIGAKLVVIPVVHGVSPMGRNLFTILVRVACAWASEFRASVSPSSDSR